MFPTKILLAVDGSEEARRAARLATALAEGLDSELQLVHVEPLPSVYAYPESAIYDPDLGHEVREAAGRSARDRLAAQAEGLGVSEKVAGTHAPVGRPDAEIVRLAEELRAGLVVVGSRGLGPIRRVLVGSVSDSIVRHAHCPVLVVRNGQQGLAGPIVLAMDGSEESKLAATAAAEISAATGSPVHVIYVMPTESRLYGHHSYSEDVKKSLTEEARAQARRFLDGRAEGVRSAGGAVAQTYLGTGSPDEEIVELAEEIDAGMVVVGSRGLGGVRRALMASVSGSVVRHAHCPVLIVRGGSDDGAAEG
ncbi:MAG TPA: universal stress protein [Rubrobacter sp.]|nr:universal stress protein [Rubrobacter sp.]